MALRLVPKVVLQVGRLLVPRMPTTKTVLLSPPQYLEEV